MTRQPSTSGGSPSAENSRQLPETKATAAAWLEAPDRSFGPFAVKGAEITGPASTACICSAGHTPGDWFLWVLSL